ncbi:MAG: helix-turn-helix transcriptional regulator [Sphingomonas sp.]
MQLAEFLKNCRARLQPSDIGLQPTARRRTPGLRREDVANMAGVSTTWYTFLEQGREVRASDRVLEGLSRALRLTVEEREYLFTLAQNRPPPLARDPGEEVSPAVRRMLVRLNVPALVMTVRWHVLAWNPMMAQHFRDYPSIPPQDRNLFKLLITCPEHLKHADEYEVMVRRIVAKLRVDYSQAADDPAFGALIEEMTEISPLFQELWHRPEIHGRSEGVHLMRHPKLGGITIEHTSYIVEGAPSLRLVIYVPHDEESADKMAELARETSGAGGRPATELDFAHILMGG